MGKETTELEWLLWFYSNCDFGPADLDVRRMLKKEFMQNVGKPLPKGYEIED
jgi:hypothetical protein